MWIWFTQDWWRFVWVPMLGLALTAMVSVWGKRSEGKENAGAVLDSRQARWIATQDTEIVDLKKTIEDLRADRDKWNWLALYWFRKAHQIAHDLLGARWKAHLSKIKLGEELEEFHPPPTLPPVDVPWNVRHDKDEGNKL